MELKKRSILSVVATAFASLVLVQCDRGDETEAVVSVGEVKGSAAGFVLKRQRADSAALRTDGFQRELQGRLGGMGVQLEELDEELKALGGAVTATVDQALRSLDGDAFADGGAVDPETMAQRWHAVSEGAEVRAIREALGEEEVAVFDRYWREVSVNLTEMLATKEFDQWQMSLGLEPEQADGLFQAIGGRWFGRLVPDAKPLESGEFDVKVREALTPAQWELYETLNKQSESLREALKKMDL